jgi:hypothetical protein
MGNSNNANNLNANNNSSTLVNNSAYLDKL